MKSLDIDKFYGVPDSQLKALCDTLFYEQGAGRELVVCANEGGAVALAAGHYLATGRPALVFMQNSGIGNALNPIVSLMDGDVYEIPCVFVVGWRGEPGVHDEPQHVKQGKITKELLELIGVTCFTIDAQTCDFDEMLAHARRIIAQNGRVAFIVKKNGLKTDVHAEYSNKNSLTRERAIEIIASFAGDDPIVSTTGKASRELYEVRERTGQGHGHDFLTVGSMGHTSMIATGIALSSDRRVWCVDGDGSFTMHMGNNAVLASLNPNLIHIVLNNGAHETVGGMPLQNDISYCALAPKLGYRECFLSNDERELGEVLKNIGAGPVLVEVKVTLGARDDLGRPKSTPIENKDEFMRTLGAK